MSTSVCVEEFPFVEELPKRAKSKLRSFWDDFAELKVLQKEHGVLVSQTIASKLLGVSRARVGQLCEARLLQVVDFHGNVFVTENSIRQRAEEERFNGRPCKSFDNLAWRFECLRIS